jgi:peroxiredoxin
LSGLLDLPPDLPTPVDDGACAHLVGTAMPHMVLPSTVGREVDVGGLGSGRTLIYCYPRTGVPGEDLPDGWDSIPGARGCTPQACAFRDHQGDLASLDVTVFGLSAQDTAYQRELADRLHLPFEILSDAQFRLTNALRLPTFEVDGMRLIRRLTLIVRDGTIEHVFYPVYPPDAHPDEVLRWLDRET